MRGMRVLLIVLTAFLGLTAVAGGVALLTGFNAPPVADLEGSLFGSYAIPGLALLVLVGGGGCAAALLTLRQHRLAVPACVAAGGTIVIFEIVEVLSIGSDPGVARNLQILYGALGLAIVVLALALRARETRGRGDGRVK